MPIWKKGSYLEHFIRRLPLLRTTAASLYKYLHWLKCSERLIIFGGRVADWLADQLDCANILTVKKYEKQFIVNICKQVN